MSYCNFHSSVILEGGVKKKSNQIRFAFALTSITGCNSRKDSDLGSLLFRFSWELDWNDTRWGYHWVSLKSCGFCCNYIYFLLAAFLNEWRNHSYNKGMALGSSEVFRVIRQDHVSLEELSFLHRKQSEVSHFLGWIAPLLKCQSTIKSQCRLQNHPHQKSQQKLTCWFSYESEICDLRFCRLTCHHSSFFIAS